MVTGSSIDSRLFRLSEAFFAITVFAAILLTMKPVYAEENPLTGFELEPNTDYSPQEVVEIVINALGNNAAYGNDQGIATVYRFASPGNRAYTGPLPRFASMIRMGFRDMLDHQGSSYDPMEIEGDVAVQAVWLKTSSNREVGYAFQVVRQNDGEYAGMWMTDAVIPLGTREARTRI